MFKKNQNYFNITIDIVSYRACYHPIKNSNRVSIEIIAESENQWPGIVSRNVCRFAPTEPVQRLRYHRDRSPP